MYKISEPYMEKVNEIVKGYSIKGEVSCLSVLESCAPYMSALCTNKPGEWIEYIYNYLLAEYFSENYQVNGNKQWEMAAVFYLETLKGVLREEKKALPFSCCRDFDFSDDDIKTSKISREYINFKKAFEDLYIYEFFRISREITPFDTLGHVAGVHFVAMHMAKQLKEAGVTVDLCLVSAAAALHDIGKFGCSEQESQRVPYLHYYYTDIFSSKLDLTVIGHTASNHSTWDLEFDNLSVENLLLIYADFRVKSTRKNGIEKVHFSSLKEAYDIILNKLDNVDNAKKERYRRVYAKLLDFECFMLRKGVDAELTGSFNAPSEGIDSVLLSTEEQVDRIKDIAISYNLRMMNIMTYESEFTDFMEELRTDKNWRSVRAYLNILDEYSTYMTRSQKDELLDYLYHMLKHREGDIRRQASSIMGKLLAGYETVYTKEIPAGAAVPQMGKTKSEIWKIILGKILIPNHKISMQESRWMGYALKNVYSTFLSNVPKSDHEELIDVLLSYYEFSKKDSTRIFVLMDCASEIDPTICTGRQKAVLFNFVMESYKLGNKEHRISALQFYLAWLRGGWKPKEKEREILRKMAADTDWEQFGLKYLRAEILCILDEDDNNILFENMDETIVSALYQENQRLDTTWDLTITNLEILQRYAQEHTDKLLQLGTHLANMLKTSDKIVVRLKAGKILTEIIPYMRPDERYEIAVELVRNLEIGEESVFKYIPKYLGAIFFHLPRAAAEEIFASFKIMIGATNDKSAVVSLETVAVIMEYLFVEMREHPERSRELLRWRGRLEGLLYMGMTHFMETVSQEAFYNIGHTLFGSKMMSLEDKCSCFLNMSKKMLSIRKKEHTLVASCDYAASWKHVYAFVSDYLFENANFPAREKKSIAFFPGTFDPFSQSHKEIVKKIHKLGFEVYTALDEFSWSKKTQHFQIRLDILQMSIADIPDVYLFPTSIPINIANDKDMEKLKEIFSGKKLYLVVGSDVVENASAYKKESNENSIHSFSHIVFYRRSDLLSSVRDYGRTVIKGDIIELELSDEFQDISSSRIRNNLDHDQDISNLVEENVQNYLYEQNLYSRQTDFVREMPQRPIAFETAESVTPEMASELESGLLKYTRWNQKRDIKKESIICIRNKANNNRIEAAILFHRILSTELFDECGDRETATRLREIVSGKIMVIAGLYGDAEKETDAVVLNEMLAYALKQEYTYVLCFENLCTSRALSWCGFIAPDGMEDCRYVCLSAPTVLFYDKEMKLKEPFEGDIEVRNVLKQCHNRLKESLTGINPGNLLLTIESDIMQHHLIQKITDENNVPSLPQERAALGEKMCVPFGSILKSVRIPNTVTKALHTERYLTPNMKNIVISEAPYSAALSTQIKTIASFGRAVILVDDTYDMGRRIEKIKPYLGKECIEISKLIVGVLSGNGRDLAKINNIPVDSVYDIPNMKTWIPESDFYPFIGGEGIWSDSEFNTNAIPSVNPILPYRIPRYMEKASRESFYEFSKICLENTLEIWQLLERLFQKKFGRKLTISQLGEVLIQPRVPDVGVGFNYDDRKAPSDFVKYELERLNRMAPTNKAGERGKR